MDEHDALNYIFGSDLKCLSEGGEIVYKICLGEKYFEFACKKDYPDSIPQVFSNVEDNVLARARAEAEKYISTPMVFDIIRTVVGILEESSIGKGGKKISTTYDVEDGQKITEEDFIEWKKRSTMIIKPKIGKTGKEIFMDIRRNKEEIHDDI